MERMRCSLTGSTRCEMEREKAVEFIKGRGVGIHLHRLGVSRFKKKRQKKKERKRRPLHVLRLYLLYVRLQVFE
jgi:hypothetical protein